MAEADRLADGPCPGVQPYGLGLLLAAARAPARPEELAGQQQVVDELVAARWGAMTAGPERKCAATVLPAARMMVVKLAAGLALVIAIASVAAKTGSLPAALQQRAHDMFSVLGVPPPAATDRQGSGPATTNHPHPPVEATSPPSHHSGPAVPAPSASGPVNPTDAKARVLCQLWAAAGRNPDGRSMTRQSWRELVELAGDKTRVPGRCAAVLGDATPSPTPSLTPSRSPAGAVGPGGRIRKDDNKDNDKVPENINKETQRDQG